MGVHRAFMDKCWWLAWVCNLLKSIELYNIKVAFNEEEELGFKSRITNWRRPEK